jgi:hypothetical protein
MQGELLGRLRVDAGSRSKRQLTSNYAGAVGLWTLDDFDHLVGFDVRVSCRCATGPADDDLLDVLRIAEPEVLSEIALAAPTSVGDDFTDLRLEATVDAGAQC